MERYPLNLNHPWITTVSFYGVLNSESDPFLDFQLGLTDM